jgi:exodeoxyribonuclease VII large subunit
MRIDGNRRVWSVSEVTAAIWRRFEDVPSVWIEAEISNLRGAGGQVYFSLLDQGVAEPHLIDASMSAVLVDRLAVRPVDGSLVQAYGRIEFWRPRSTVRLRVERLEPAGRGLLLARIDELRRRLVAEGLTDEARKRALPMLPRRIGLVTSGEGAARVDFLQNVVARFPAADVLVVRTQVQGDTAPGQIVRAVRYLDSVPEVEVIVLARGGGSLEDLMPFNAEPVCRAVAASGTPVVSAIGHETDTTLVDLVADLRVSTPTKAAEAVVPDAAALVRRLDAARSAVRAVVERSARSGGSRLDELAGRLGRALRGRGDVAEARLGGVAVRLAPALVRRAGASESLVAARVGRLEPALRSAEARAAARAERGAALLTALSPAATVARGYAIVRDAGSGAVVADAGAVRDGQDLAIDMRGGRVAARAKAAA